ncbi:hypothetical protein ACFCZ1_26875 [Streptomyces sp. NPDC056224]|uniref:hypothetical protein n=1 Tax=Streptomyces sp. NPDC056224 TaxID=3345750 RepID=UPI0035E0BF8B
MSRSRNGTGGWIGVLVSLIGSCIGVFVVLMLFFAFVIYKFGIDDGPSSEPASRPTATTGTVTPPAFPETEEEAESDDNGGTGSKDQGQVGIQFGYACSPVGALGLAKDGRPAKCFMGKDGLRRWGYDSNRG